MAILNSKTNKLIAERIDRQRQKLSEWHLRHSAEAPPPLYSSVDLRDSGEKIVPVDCNLYPAGFNNICPADLRTAPPVFRAEVDAQFAALDLESPKKILILPESHTQNAYYIENLTYLSDIIRNAGFEVRVGWYGKLPEGENTKVVQLVSASKKNVEALPIQIENGTMIAGDFTPELILLNNDFSAGYPKELDLVKQPILPSHTMGWHSRKKSEHFKYYNELATEFAEILDIDPWLIQIDTASVENVNFNENVGVEEVARAADQMLKRIQKVYDSRGIQQKPFVFVKNDAGTYGIGITVIHSADELLHMNRRTKNKMSVGKNHRPIVSVAIQEGIPTTTTVETKVAEPVVYLFGGELMGGFLRTNPERTREDNLNAPGMVFKKLCMSDLRDEGNEPVLELVYGWIARISALAAGKEIKTKGRHT